MKRFLSILTCLGVCLGSTQVSAALVSPPETYVSRAEAITILLKSRGSLPPVRRQIIFRDVPEKEWFSPYMRAAVDLRMIENETGYLYPHQPVTRAEFLKMMKYALSLPINSPHRYKDVAADDWFAPYAGTAYLHDLFGPKTTPAYLDPGKMVTHPEAVIAINNLATAYTTGLPFQQVQIGDFRPSSPATTVVLPKSSASSSASSSSQAVTRSLLQNAMQRLMSRLFGSTAKETTSLKFELLLALNAERTKENLPNFRTNLYLEQAAQRHAKDMYDRGYFSHFTPEGLNYVDRIRSAGYLDTNPDACQCKQVFDVGATEERGANYVVVGKQACNCSPSFSMGENIARGYFVVENVVRDWMNSPPHRKNILQTQFDEVGIGIYKDIWVLDFGRLKFE